MPIIAAIRSFSEAHPPGLTRHWPRMLTGART